MATKKAAKKPAKKAAKKSVKKAAIERTARRLMEGYALLEKSKDPRKK